MESEIILEKSVEFTGTNGGTITMLGTADDLMKVGIEDGYAVYDDFGVNPSADMTLNVSGEYVVTGSVEHTTGDPVMTFSLTSREPNGTADIRLIGLQPEGWYRLRLGGQLAKTAGGRAHGQASVDGELIFIGVNIP